MGRPRRRYLVIAVIAVLSIWLGYLAWSAFRLDRGIEVSLAVRSSFHRVESLVLQVVTSPDAIFVAEQIAIAIQEGDSRVRELTEFYESFATTDAESRALRSFVGGWNRIRESVLAIESRIKEMADLAEFALQRGSGLLDFLFDPDVPEEVRRKIFWLRIDVRSVVNARIFEAVIGPFFDGFESRLRRSAAGVRVQSVVASFLLAVAMVGWYRGRRKTEAARMREFQAMLRGLAGKLNVVFFALDREGTTILSEGKGLDIFGLKPGDAVGRSAFDTYRDNPEAISGLRRALAGEAFSHEIKIGDHYLDMRYGPMTDERGRLVGSVGVAVDVTVRRRLGKEVENQRRLLRLILDTIPVRVFWKDLDCRYLGANRLFADDAGLSSPEDIVGADDHDLRWSAQADLYQADDRAVASSGQPKLGYEEPRKTLGGDLIWLRTSKVPLKDGEGRVFGVLGSYEDITQWKRLEEELRHREEHLATTLDSIGDAVIATDANGLVQRMNPVAARLTGWTGKEAVGRPLSDVFHIVNQDTRVEVENPVNRVMREGCVVGLANHTRLVSRDGLEYQIADSGAPIRDSYGRIVGVVLVFRDVTEQYHVQEQFRRAQKMESIGRLAGNIAHDFNNLLAGITGYAEVLVDRLSAGRADLEDERRYAEGILTTAGRAREIVARLLIFARRAPVSRAVVVLDDVVRSVVAILTHSLDRRIRIRTELANGLPAIRADAGQLEAAVMNLAINAQDAMPEGGVLTITTELEWGCKDADLVLVPESSGPHVALSVADTGEGIPPELMDRLFEPFFTTKEEGRGTGLGLPAVYGTVKEVGGGIGVKSRVGAGARFTLYFPPYATPSGSSVFEKPAAGENNTERFSGTVLLVDDEPVVLDAAEALLRGLGLDVVAVGSGSEAVRLFNSRPQGFTIGFFDVLMPDMDGLALREAVHETRPDFPVILTSGFSGDLDPSRYERAAAFLPKPYRRADLVAAVRRAFAKIADQSGVFKNQGYRRDEERRL